MGISELRRLDRWEFPSIGLYTAQGGMRKFLEPFELLASLAKPGHAMPGDPQFCYYSSRSTMPMIHCGLN